MDNFPDVTFETPESIMDYFNIPVSYTHLRDIEDREIELAFSKEEPEE